MMSEMLMLILLFLLRVEAFLVLLEIGVEMSYCAMVSAGVTMVMRPGMSMCFSMGLVLLSLLSFVLSGFGLLEVFPVPYEHDSYYYGSQYRQPDYYSHCSGTCISTV
jgi:hypothetical protein